MVPLLDIVRPVGRPAAEKVYPTPVPPVAVMVTGVMATFCTALITTQVALGGELMVMPQLLVAVPARVLVESCTWATNRNGPAWVGVPVMAPVVGFSVNPLGSVPDLME